MMASDPLKLSIAAHVKKSIQTAEFSGSNLDIESIEYHDTDTPLLTVVRVVSNSREVRYFNVQVSERQ